MVSLRAVILIVSFACGSFALPAERLEKEAGWVGKPGCAFADQWGQKFRLFNRIKNPKQYKGYRLCCQNSLWGKNPDAHENCLVKLEMPGHKHRGLNNKGGKPNAASWFPFEQQADQPGAAQSTD
ncbi:hypothetical protein FRB94_010522 [Tulasnella sp. JGI-2019a]|nr:hypothetical protein FRB94_010522 [Tulasnella sp. JGI-2019a]